MSAQVLLDRERCVNCARCTRFADQVAGDPFIVLLERGGRQQVGINPGHPFDSYFSGNTVQICPVGALTSAKYRFRARPFDLVSVPTVCEHCASGCALRTDHRRGVATRRLAWDDPQVNEEWNCDKGRFGFAYSDPQRLTHPLVRRDGELQPASWPEAIQAVAEGLVASRGKTGVLTGGRLTVEDALAYSMFARAVLGTDDVDFRARSGSAEEAAFLSSLIAGTGIGVTYTDLERAPSVLLVAFEPEDESPIVFLRLRKAVRRHGQRVVTIAPLTSPGSRKVKADVVATAPGDEVAALRDPAVVSAITDSGAVILVGERAAAVPGLLSAVSALAQSSGARLAWIPRRAGERGALDAGLLPGLLPGGRSLTDAAARADVAAAFGVGTQVLPAHVGRDAVAMIAAIRQDAAARATAEEEGTLDEFVPTLPALVVAGVDPDDLPNPKAMREALSHVGFLVSLEQRLTEVAAEADVVLPIAEVGEKAGTFVDWEGRPRPFRAVFPSAAAMSDARVLSLLADAIAGIVDEPVTTLFRGDVDGLRAAMQGLLGHAGPRPAGPQAPDAAPESSQPGEPNDGGVRLATWRQLIDSGTLQQGDPYLAASAREPLARVSPRTAADHGLADGHPVTITSDSGAATLVARVVDMADGVVWVPANSPGIRVSTDLGAAWGDSVRLAPHGVQPAGEEA